MTSEHEQTVVDLINTNWTKAQRKRLKEWCADGWPISAGVCDAPFYGYSWVEDVEKQLGIP